jgi:hypothetical protein
MVIDDADSVYLSVNDAEVIGGRIETTIRFGDTWLTCQSYYCQQVVHDEEQAIRAARIINYCNHSLNWDCNELYEHVYVLDEEHGEIYNFCRCRLELVEKYFSNTMDHILNFSVQQLQDICVPVLFYIYDKITFEEATEKINREVRGII